MSAERPEEKQVKPTALKAASVDEFKLGGWWMCTLTEGKSQTIVGYALCESRDEEVVRELNARHDPKLIISDGCSSIQAACGYFADKPHGRCWFHVIKEGVKRFSRKERVVALDLRFLYTCANLKDAGWFLGVLTACTAKAGLNLFWAPGHSLNSTGSHALNQWS